MFNLKKLLNETYAQVNPFDGGRTAATVKASYQKPPPAQTISQPKGQVSVGVPQRQPAWQAPKINGGAVRIGATVKTSDPSTWSQIKQFGPSALADTFTKPQAWDNAPKVNVGSFKGSGLVEDFVNSPFKQGKGLVQVGQGDVKQGLGNVVAGSIEGPLGLLPVGKTAQAGSKVTTGLLPKIIQGAKVGAREGAVYGGAYGGAQAASQDGSFGDIAKSTAIGTVVGGAGGGLLGGGAPVARVTTKLVGSGVSKVDNTLPFTPRGRVNVSEQNVLRDYSDALVGANKAQGRELSDLIGQTQQIGKKYGVDLTNGSMADRLERSNSILDQIGQKQLTPLNNEIGAVGKNVKAATVAPEAQRILEANGIATKPNLQQPKTPATPSVLDRLPKVPQKSVSSSAPVIPQVADDVSKILNGQEVKERGFAKTVRESGKTPKIEAIDNGTYVVKSDKQRIADAREYIKSDPVKAQEVALNPQSDIHVTIGNQLLDHYIATGQLDKFRTLNSGMAESGTELGRAIHSFADYNKTTPSGAVKFAEKTIRQYNKANPKKQLSLSNDDIKGLVTKAQEVQKMPEGRARNIEEHRLMEQVNNLIPSTIADKAITVWKAGLLTSPRTTMRNVLGNAMHGVAEVAKDIPASLNDILLKQRTGQRSLTFTTKGELGGIKEGFKSAGDIVKTGYDPEQALNKYDFRHVTWEQTPVQQALKKYTDFVFRSLGAQDQPYYHGAFARSLYDQAGAAAKNAGKSGDAKFIQNLVENPTEQMKVAATKDASVATFKNDNVLRDIAGKFKKTLGKTEAGKVISEVVAPFTGVPSSIAGQMVAYSPVGLTKGVAKDIKVLTKNLPELQRQASQEIGRGVIGTGILGIGAYLTAQGLMTGNPKDAEESRQWELEGKQANSVFVNGKWRSINSIGPEALILLAGSKIQSGKANEEGTGKVIANIGKDFSKQTFLQGVQGPLNAISDPDRYADTYIRGQAASVIPNIVKDTSKALDSTQRETNSLSDALKSGIPGARNTLVPKRDALGNPLKQEPSGVNAFVDLFNSKTPIKNDVVNELSRLYKEDQSATPSKLKKDQTIQGQKVKLNPQQLDKLEAITGQSITKEFTELIASPDYQNAPDELKKKALDSVVNKVRKEARNKSLEVLSRKPSNEGTLLDTIGAYATAFKTSPATAFNRIFSGQKIRRTNNGAIIVERLPESESQKIKQEQGGDNASMKLDHTIPLQLGGSNDKDNLKLVTTEKHSSYTPVENFLGDRLQTNQIKAKKAEKLILAFKRGEMTADQVYEEAGGKVSVKDLPKTDIGESANEILNNQPKSLTSKTTKKSKSEKIEQWREPVSKVFPANEVTKMLWVIEHESGGDPEAVGDGGAAYGLFQNQHIRTGASVDEQLKDALRLYNADKAAGGTGYGDWGEGRTYEGKKFGALGNHPYPGDDKAKAYLASNNRRGSTSSKTVSKSGGSSKKKSGSRTASYKLSDILGSSMTINKSLRRLLKEAHL